MDRKDSCPAVSQICSCARRRAWAWIVDCALDRGSVVRCASRGGDGDERSVRVAHRKDGRCTERTVDRPTSSRSHSLAAWPNKQQTQATSRTTTRRHACRNMFAQERTTVGGGVRCWKCQMVKWRRAHLDRLVRDAHHPRAELDADREIVHGLEALIGELEEEA